MENEQIKVFINKYIDGELAFENEKLMFKALSENEELRNYYKNCTHSKKIIQLTKEDYPSNLDKLIFNSIKLTGKENKRPNRNLLLGFSFAFSIIIILFSYILITENIRFKQDINLTINKVNEQNKKIEMLLNTFPAIEVKTSFDKEIIIKTN
ncbi:MAG: hypothetical protein V1773_00250 [bacterium]